MNEMNERCRIRVSFIALIAVLGTCHGPKGTVNTTIDECIAVLLHRSFVVGRRSSCAVRLSLCVVSLVRFGSVRFVSV